MRQRITASSRQQAGGKGLTTAYCLLPIAYFFITVIIFFPTITTAQRSKDHKPHHEDLTVHRLQFPETKDSVIRKDIEDQNMEILPAANSVRGKVDKVLDSIARFNKTKMFVDGYTIQIYSGLKKEEAMNAKKKIIEGVKDLVADLKYEQPKWRVKTGSYFTRLEAQRDLHRLKQIFPNAILVPEKVALK